MSRGFQGAAAADSWTAFPVAYEASFPSDRALKGPDGGLGAMVQSANCHRETATGGRLGTGKR
jgi:hypothetical protein